MTPAERMRHRYNIRKRQHRCVQCAERLPPDDEHIRCSECREGHLEYSEKLRRQRGAKPWDRPTFQQQLAAIIETKDLSIRKQAAMLGVGVERVYVLRAAARRRGKEIPMGVAHTGGYHGPASKKWAELDKVMTTSCERCGLRGDHECVQMNAQDRRGAGAVYPEGGI